MQSRDIEEVFKAIQQGTYELDDFKTWLALWSMKVLDLCSPPEDTNDDIVFRH